MKALLANVPASRLFDEMIKLLQTGHSLASLEVLKKYGLDRKTFPILDAHFEGIAKNPAREAFVNRALADTDRRVNEGKPVAPSFLMACVFWHEVSSRWQALRDEGVPLMPALQDAVDATFDARIGDISGRGKLAADMREIWLMQPRFERRTASSAMALIGQARFRAGYDFLRLRADCDEIKPELADWWEDFHLGSDDEREALLEQARSSAPARARREPAGAGAGGALPAASGAGGGSVAEDAEPAESDAAPPRKRRRRRRRAPGGSEGTATADQGSSQPPPAPEGA
jgi:poly(A) polymerase